MKNVPSEKSQVPVDQLKEGPGSSHLDPKASAFPLYNLMSHLRHPVALRDLMIIPVRTGYIGQDHPLDPANLPPSGASLFPDVEVSEVYVPSPDGPIRCAIYRPKKIADGRPIILYAHGGGFMVGSSEDTDFITRKLASQNEMTVVSVNYRLAPEFPFPAGLNDFFNVYIWLLKHGNELGGDTSRLIISGDSSGSNFAAVIPFKARDEGLRLPSAIVLFGPVVDINFERYESFNREAPLGIIYDSAFIGFLRGAYSPQPTLWNHPHVSPIFGDFTDYPPTLLIVGTADPVVDSTKAFATKHQQASHTECALFVSEGMPHGFYFFPKLFVQEEEAFESVQKFLKRNLNL